MEIYSFIPRLNLDRIKWYWVHQSCDNGIPVLAFPGTFSYMVQLVFTYTSRHLDITEYVDYGTQYQYMYKEMININSKLHTAVSGSYIIKNEIKIDQHVFV